MEPETGFLHIERSSELWDELFTFSGLDDVDLKNYILVVEYVNCLKRFVMLDEIISGQEHVFSCQIP